MTVAAEYRTSPGVPSRLAPIRLHGLPISDFPEPRARGGKSALCQHRLVPYLLSLMSLPTTTGMTCAAHGRAARRQRPM